MTQTTSQAAAALSSKWHPYPAYKDSGVEWLGEIPAHWEVNRLKFTSQVNPSKSDISHLPIDTEVSFLPMERIGEDGTTSLEETRLIEQVRQGYTYFQDGDVIIAKITPCFENGKGALCNGLVNGIGFGTTELYVLRVNKGNDPKFFFYLTKSEPFREIGAAMMYGAAGQQRVPGDFVSNFRIGLTSLSEQQAIAAFLDRETARVNALIVKKERLIELLQENRAALISHAVTKGLDPAAPMKDSGIAWLGEIPTHWEVKRLKFIAAEPLKYGANESGELDDPNLPRYIRITDIDEDGSLREDTYRSLPEEIAEPYLLKDGDLLFARSGATVGKSILYHKIWGRACYAGYLIRLRINRLVSDPKFISYFAVSPAYQNWLSSVFIQATIQNVSAEKYANLSVSIPPLSEQQAIVAYLDRETAKIDTLIARVRKGIAKVQEYSAALIAAAVTGKIDVREVV
ncbi:MAG: restriction endonuclease subunit S [Ktedonobacteraceae bacterium]